MKHLKLKHTALGKAIEGNDEAQIGLATVIAEAMLKGKKQAMKEVPPLALRILRSSDFGRTWHEVCTFMEKPGAEGPGEPGRAEVLNEKQSTNLDIPTPELPNDPAVLKAVIRSGEEHVALALQVAFSHGGTDGGHHKQWVIDQMVRALCGDRYKKWVSMFEESAESEWDKGIAP